MPPDTYQSLSGLSAILGPVYFWLFAAVAVGCGAGLLICRHPLSGALNLIGVMLSLSGIYTLLNSPFLGVLQILVYAGAIMMLVVFVIMVLNHARDSARITRFDALSLAGLATAAALCFLVCSALGAHPTREAMTHQGSAMRGEVAPVAQALFDLSPAGPGYYVLFELIGVLLLVAIVGAVLLAKRKLDSPAETAAEDDHAH